MPGTGPGMTGCLSMRLSRVPLLLIPPHLLECLRIFQRPPSRDLQRFGEISRVDPALRRHRFGQSLVPDPSRLDIELHVELLVDRLNAIAGHGPLLAEPIDVAM